jgi:hypothetical protein
MPLVALLTRAKGCVNVEKCTAACSSPSLHTGARAPPRCATLWWGVNVRVTSSYGLFRCQRKSVPTIAHHEGSCQRSSAFAAVVHELATPPHRYPERLEFGIQPFTANKPSFMSHLHNRSTAWADGRAERRGERALDNPRAANVGQHRDELRNHNIRDSPSLIGGGVRGRTRHPGST